MEKHQQAALTVHRITVADMVAVLDQLLARRPGVRTESENMAGADICGDSAECYQVRADGRPVMHYALERVRRANGEVDGYVIAADGKCSGVDLTRTMMPHIERQMADCHTLIIYTARRGLAAKLSSLGYSLGGVVLRKKLK